MYVLIDRMCFGIPYCPSRSGLIVQDARHNETAPLLQLLRAVNRRDVSTLFRGQQGGHTHSEAAWKMLEGFRNEEPHGPPRTDAAGAREPVDLTRPIIAQASTG